METQTYNYLGNIHFKANKITESEKYYRKAIAFFNKETYPTDFCIANIGLAKIAMFRNNYAEAEARARENLEISRRRNIRLEEKNTLSFLWELSVAKHDYVNRNRYKAAFDSVQHLVVNDNMLRAVEELEIRYETEKKEMRIAGLESEKRLMVWLGITIGGALLLGIATLFFLWRWTVRKKQLVATQAMLDGEVQERTRLARDLHDGLGSILAAAKYYITDTKKVEELLDKAMREMRRIAHHLMPESLGEGGLKTSLSSFCHSVPIVKFAWYGDEVRLDSKLEVMVYRVVHELVNNALKHSGASHILVQIAQEKNRLALTVQDNGCGFDVSSASSKGMGLSNVRLRVAAYNGSLLIDSKPGAGTEIHAEFSIK